MSYVLVDRRKSGKGKSIPNRQKLIKRIKSFIKNSSPQNLGLTSAGGVTSRNNNMTSPVGVAGSALEEPYFGYTLDGDRTYILIGNDEYERGDMIDIPPSDPDPVPGAGQGGGGEDDFVVNVAHEEFFNYFFEDCVLPNLTNTKEDEQFDTTPRPAGFTATGIPSQLSVIRTYKQYIARSAAMISPLKEELEELERELAAAEKQHADMCSEPEKSIHDDIDRGVMSVKITDLKARIEEIKGEIVQFSGFDTTDMRFRKYDPKPLTTIDAVVIMIMDISGSMDEERKRIARRWFALFYAFINRAYPSTEIVFIAHTDDAFELSEDDFFSTRINGGTSVSPALKMANNIIKARYDYTKTNIYICHASDGDNWEEDNTLIEEELIRNGLLSKIQMLSYIEVGTSLFSIFQTILKKVVDKQVNSNLWNAYDSVRLKSNTDKIIMNVIENADEVYPTFRAVFKKK